MAPKARIEEFLPAVAPHQKIPLEEGRFIIKNREAHTYLFLDAEGVQMLQWMDGKTSVKEILQKQLKSSGRLSSKKLFDLLQQCYRQDFLEGDEAARFFPPRPSRRPPLFPLTFPIPPLQKLRFVRFLARPLAMPLLSALSLLALFLLVFLFPPPQEVNIFAVQGSYARGILSFFLVACSSLSFQQLVRFGLLRQFQCEPLRVGITLYGVFPIFSVDSRDIVCAKAPQRARFYLGSLAALASIPLTLQALQLLLPTPNPYLMNALFVTLLLLYADLCPFLPTDTFRLMESLFPATEFRRHSATYLKKRFLSRMLSRSAVPEEEKFYILLGLFSYFWFYAGFLLYLGGPAFQVLELVSTFPQSPFSDKAAIALLLLCLLLPLILMAGSFLLSLLSNLSQLFPKAPSSGKGKTWHPSSEEIARFLREHPLFYGFQPSDFAALSAAVVPLSFKKREKIIVQGEKGDTFYMLYEGEVEVLFEALSGAETQLAVLSSGDSFGEIALLEDVPRTATVRTLSPCKVLSLSRPAFHQYLATSEEKKEQLTALIRLFGQIHKMPIFTELAQEQMAKLLKKLKRQAVAKGTTIIREGETADNFYIVAEGVFGVTSKGEKLAELKAGEAFGEIALLKNIPRTATVTAQTQGILYSLTSSDFFDILSQSLYAGTLLEEIAEERLAKLKKG